MPSISSRRKSSSKTKPAPQLPAEDVPDDGCNADRKEKTAQINILAGQLQTVMDIMDKGIITVDSIGDIKYKNSIADSVLGITQQRFRNVQEIINRTSIKDFRLGKKLKSREFEYRHPSGKVTGGIISTKIIESEEGAQSSVFIIQEMQGLIKSARSLISANIATPFDNIIHRSRIMEDTIKLAKKLRRAIPRSS